MFVLVSNITIGDYVGVKPIEVRITKSLYEYVDKAVIKLPVSSRIKKAGVVITESIQTAKNFKEGDKVSINLGYNNSLKNEFVGFVSRVDFTTPVELACEGYSYILRKRTYTQKFIKAQLRDILKYLVNGTEITLSPAIPDFIIDKLILQEHSGTEVLELIKKISHNTIQPYFKGSQLFAGLIFMDTSTRTNNDPDVKYKLGWNVIKDGNLKLRQASNDKVNIKFLGVSKSGDVTQAEEGYILSPKTTKVKTVGASGTEGETKVVQTHAITDSSTLTKMAKEMQSRLSYTGYEGKILAFLQPYCEHGHKASLEDTDFPERNGTYLIESVEITYGLSGARRMVQIGIKI